jgi:outer membrane immunogenic protein
MLLRCSVIVGVSLISLAANAADLGAPAGGGFKDAPYVSAPTWTGFYAGAHGGYAWIDPDVTSEPAYPAGPPRPHLDGGFVGSQIGFNLQLDRFVVGAVADISFADLNQTVRDGNYLTETAKIDKLGTVRAVLGYSFGRWLPYGTVGLGWAHQSYDLTCPDAAAAPYGMCQYAGPRHVGDDQILTGLAYGGGLKFAIDDHFSIGAEYLHLALDEKAYSFGPFAAKAPSTKRLDASGDLVKLSVDYKVGGWGYAPLK